MKNKKNINLIEQKELLVNYTKKSKKEDYYKFKMNTLKINISQNVLSIVISLLEINKKEEENNMSYRINNMNILTKNSKSLIMFERENDNNKLSINSNHKRNVLDKDEQKNINKIEKEYCLEAEGELHNINIGICLNNYTKKSDLNIGNVGLYLKNANIKNNENYKMEKLIEYKVLVDRIILKYFDHFNNEIIILNYYKEKKKELRKK